MGYGHKNKTVEQKFNEFWQRLSKDNKLPPLERPLQASALWAIVKESFAAGYECGHERGHEEGFDLGYEQGFYRCMETHDFES